MRPKWSRNLAGLNQILAVLIGVTLAVGEAVRSWGAGLGLLVRAALPQLLSPLADPGPGGPRQRAARLRTAGRSSLLCRLDPGATDDALAGAGREGRQCIDGDRFKIGHLIGLDSK